MNETDKNINKKPDWISMVLPTIVTGVLSWFFGKFVEPTLRTEYISGFLEATRLEIADVAETVKLLSEVYSARALLDFAQFLFVFIVISFFMAPSSLALILFLLLVLFAIYVGVRLHIRWLGSVVFIILIVLLVAVISRVHKKWGDIGFILLVVVLFVFALVLLRPLLHLLFFAENAPPEAHTAADIFVDFINPVWGLPGLIVSLWLIFLYFKSKYQKQSPILMPCSLQNRRSREINRAKLVADVVRVIIIIITAGYIYLVARFSISYSAQMAKYSGWAAGVEKVCHSSQIALPGVEPNQPTFLLERTNGEIFVFTITVQTTMPTPMPEFSIILITQDLYATLPFSIGCSPAVINVLPATETFKILPPDEQVKPGECCYRLFGPTPTPVPTPAPTPKPHISLRKLNG